MKIAISSMGETLDSQIDTRFGRAKGFIIYDVEQDTFVYKCNTQNMEAAQGAGIQAAQNVINEDVELLITGHCGPKAFAVLVAANVRIFTKMEGTVKEAIEDYKQGKLKEISSPDVNGHWV